MDTVKGVVSRVLSPKYVDMLQYSSRCTTVRLPSAGGKKWYQLSLPDPLPLPKTTVRVVSPVKYRYYMNVCTVSYSMVRWDWDRWQRELDWMAMNGINLPLSFTGQEYVWWQLYRKVGLTEQTFDYFSGLVFLAWQRMGNIKKWAGPLSESWCLAQRDLQSNILARSQQLDMLSVLPDFASQTLVTCTL